MDDSRQSTVDSGPFAEGEYKEVQIKDVKPGTQVFSLDEATGKLIPATITALLDMGAKPVFELITKSGKNIRTTGNHPYLVKGYSPHKVSAVQKLGFELEDGSVVLEESVQENATWVKVAGLDVGDRIAVVESGAGSTGGLGGTTSFGELNSNIDQSKGNSSQTKSDLGTSYSFSKINHFLDNPSSLIDNNKHSIANSKLAVNLNGSATPSKVINQPAAKSENKDDKTLASSDANSKEGVLNRFNFGTGTSITYPNVPGGTVQGSRFKVQGIKFEKIISIKYVGEEQVYDIAVEGTRNFIGNGIVAHNTYISGGSAALGVGYDPGDISGGVLRQ